MTKPLLLDLFNHPLSEGSTVIYLAGPFFPLQAKIIFLDDEYNIVVSLDPSYLDITCESKQLVVTDYLLSVRQPYKIPPPDKLGYYDPYGYPITQDSIVSSEYFMKTQSQEEHRDPLFLGLPAISRASYIPLDYRKRYPDDVIVLDAQIKYNKSTFPEYHF